jgi:hypothetical protein
MVACHEARSALGRVVRPGGLVVTGERQGSGDAPCRSCFSKGRLRPEERLKRLRRRRGKTVSEFMLQHASSVAERRSAEASTQTPPGWWSV